VCYSLVKSSK